MRTLRGEIHRSTVLRNLQDEIYWGKQYKPLLGSQQNKSTRGRQSNSPGSNETTLLERNESTLLGESKGKPAGDSPINPWKIPLGEIKNPLGKLNQATLWGWGFMQTSDKTDCLGNNCYSIGDDPQYQLSWGCGYRPAAITHPILWRDKLCWRGNCFAGEGLNNPRLGEWFCLGKALLGNAHRWRPYRGKYSQVTTRKSEQQMPQGVYGQDTLKCPRHSKMIFKCFNLLHVIV